HVTAVATNERGRARAYDQFGRGALDAPRAAKKRGQTLGRDVGATVVQNDAPELPKGAGTAPHLDEVRRRRRHLGRDNPGQCDDQKQPEPGAPFQLFAPGVPAILAIARVGHKAFPGRTERFGRPPYVPAAAAGSPRDSIRRFAQLKNAAAWMTSAIARSSSPERRRRSTCSGPNATGVAVSATAAATIAFQRSPRSAAAPVSSKRSTSVSRFE